jgi:hypothetical protein
MSIRTAGSVWKEYFTKLSPKRLNFFTPSDLPMTPGEAGTGSFGAGVFPIACLTLGIVLGGGIGATLAPQLLHAEGAGVYDFIRMNDAMMRARHSAPVAAPRVALPQVTLRRRHGRAGVMQARLSPDEPRLSRNRGEHPLVHLKSAPEIGPGSGCGNCEVARYGSPIEAILHDRTLRAGDTVMMGYGAVVFRGAEHMPYTEADFSDFRKSTLLTQKERKLIDDDLGLSRRAELMRSFVSKARDAKPAEFARAAGSHSTVSP